MFKEEFLAIKPIPWITEDSQEVAGSVRSVGGDGFTAGNVTFVVVNEAGYDRWRVLSSPGTDKFYRHMVPFDQPEAALVSHHVRR